MMRAENDFWLFLISNLSKTADLKDIIKGNAMKLQIQLNKEFDPIEILSRWYVFIFCA